MIPLPYARLFVKVRSIFLRPLLAWPLALALAGLHAASAGSDADRFWPQWRGPLATGAAPWPTRP